MRFSPNRENPYRNDGNLRNFSPLRESRENSFPRKLAAYCNDSYDDYVPLRIVPPCSPVQATIETEYEYVFEMPYICPFFRHNNVEKMLLSEHIFPQEKEPEIKVTPLHPSLMKRGLDHETFKEF